MNPATDDPLIRQSEFFQRLADPNSLLDLFDSLADVSVFFKDSGGGYVRANQTLISLFGLEKPSDVIGKTDFDFFPPAIAARYADEDQLVITSRAPLLDARGFMPGPEGYPLWYSCSKRPLFNQEGVVIGVAGIKRACETFRDDGSSRFGRLLRAVQFVSSHYHQSISVADLAAQVDLSVSQLQREFSRILEISPNRYIQEVRIGVTRHLLRTSDMNMSAIANNCGFFDQSHFSRQFKTATGLTPMEYRSRNSRL